MNFLAHIYLSGNNHFLKLGNFIADAVKGKTYSKYPLEIQQGILLHRKIDSFTDHHPIFKKSVSRLFPTHRHYSRVIIDIFYDHFLAKEWNTYSNIPLNTYINDFYSLLNDNYEYLPKRIKAFFT